jgi:hypothetical protein
MVGKLYTRPHPWQHLRQRLACQAYPPSLWQLIVCSTWCRKQPLSAIANKEDAMPVEAKDLWGLAPDHLQVDPTESPYRASSPTVAQGRRESLA